MITDLHELGNYSYKLILERKLEYNYKRSSALNRPSKIKTIDIKKLLHKSELDSV